MMMPSVMKPAKTVALYILLLLTIISCAGGSGKGSKTVISGKFPGFGGARVSLSEIDINKATPIDTVVISVNGSFRFNFRRPAPGFYLVKVDNRNYITLVLDQERKIKIWAEGKDLRRNYRVEGSEDSELYRQFEVFNETNRNKVDSLRKTYTNYQRSPGFQSLSPKLDEEYEEIFEQQKQYVISFLNNHCESLASLLVINRRFGERQVLSGEDDAQYFISLDSCLSVKYPENKHLLEFKKRLETIQSRLRTRELAEAKLAIGKKLPDVELLDMNDKKRTLHALAGKPVIVYFWASWDKPCQEVNTRLKDFLEKMGPGRPEVFAIGLESYKEMWENAIRRDGTGSWVHVTDYLNVNSSVRTLFNLPDKLPYFYLLDKDLIVLEKGGNIESLVNALNNLPK